MKHRTSRLSIVALALICPSFLHASNGFLINFENPPYSPGDLFGQGVPGLRWAGGAGRGIDVEIGKGIGGSQAAVTSNPAASTQLLLTPEPQFIEGFNGNASIISYRFAYRYDDTPNSTASDAFVVIFGFTDTTNYAARLSIQPNGRLTYSTTGSAARASRNENGQDYIVSDTTTWTLVHGELNFDTKTYTLFVDGVEQEPGALGFFGGSEVMTTRFQNVANAGYIPVVVDDLEFQVIPEPSSHAMLLLGLGGLGLITRRTLALRH